MNADEGRRVKQLEINCSWLLQQIDAIFYSLCSPMDIGTWQHRAERAVERAMELSRKFGGLLDLIKESQTHLQWWLDTYGSDSIAHVENMHTKTKALILALAAPPSRKAPYVPRYIVAPMWVGAKPYKFTRNDKKGKWVKWEDVRALLYPSVVFDETGHVASFKPPEEPVHERITQ